MRTAHPTPAARAVRFGQVLSRIETRAAGRWTLPSHPIPRLRPLDSNSIATEDPHQDHNDHRLAIMTVLSSSDRAGTAQRPPGRVRDAGRIDR